MTLATTDPRDSDCRKYSLDDSLVFAQVSGDSNPLHVDPLAARRTVFGKPVVHGMHLVMHGLHHLCRTTGRIRLTSLTGTFLKPVLVDDEVKFSLQQRSEHNFRVTVDSGRQVAFFDVQFRSDHSVYDVRPAAQQTPSPCLQTKDFAEIADADGQIPCVINERLFEKRFPIVFQSIPRKQWTDLVVSSTLVGMECPGEYSVYSRYRLEFRDEINSDCGNRMEYRVTGVDERFHMVTMSICTSSYVGEIVAFVRPRPTNQISMARAASTVSSDEFEATHALVVGGSRGLGETACKLLAAGGASVTLTYTRGLEDAERVQREIADVGTTIQIAKLDVLDSQSFVLDVAPGKCLSVFYFATPSISASASGFSADKFRSFCDYYVTGLSQLLDGLRKQGCRITYLLCPSTVFLDAPVHGMAEYAAAKAASETLCRSLADKRDGLKVTIPRWPKMKTDQTAAMVPEIFADSREIVLTSIRELLNSSDG